MLQRIKSKIFNLSLYKILLILSSISVLVPMILITSIASIYYYFGIEKIFSDKIKNAFDEIVEISHLYMDENINNIKSDILILSHELHRVFIDQKKDLDLLTAFLNQQTNRLKLTEAIIVKDNEIVGRSDVSFTWVFDKPDDVEKEYNDLRNGELVAIKKNDINNKVIAIIKLDSVFNEMSFRNMYLVATKYIDDNISYHLVNSEESLKTYNQLKDDMEKIRFKTFSTLLFTTFGLLFITIFFTNKFAKTISTPIGKLAEATSRIRKGDYKFKISENQGNKEIIKLSKAFNIMTETIDLQRNDLLNANKEISARSNLLEGVLAESSAGIMSINSEGNIELYNNSVIKLLKIKDNIIGKKYLEILPELEKVIGYLFDKNKIFDKELNKNDANSKSHIEIKITTKHQRELFVKIRIIFRSTSENIDFIIITFDDITDLVAGQRFAVWADVARRIAHEIKNPLTPIQLCTERLEKKFTIQIHSDLDQFKKYLSTIGKRVEDIKQMINEFVSFARISAPKLEQNNIVLIIKENILLQKAQFNNIEYIFNNEKDLYVYCDSMQINQILTNLLKNAAESILSYLNLKNNKDGENGRIKIDLKNLSAKGEGDFIEIQIIDNGMGIDPKMLSTICEPYVTTKKEGNGLGLSIVKKIVEEHGGIFKINNNLKGHGINVKFTLKKFNK